ncbi:iron-siderophore ABC transporter substrate-binding protein [Leucobacter massiliensis]|uniref:ABC transporter substrate-binding protein n=1 Tax=Leucobacter massiliensis TaxID=1686285 RepID=A0A2S9QRI8_9MICO|nr:iron-siderophore ABC transporter substrate-binding protein [Leucobacter massiliensis]PRI12204.1 ABC transporter substrate-binding protein [Leucobacter massiliensis]
MRLTRLLAGLTALTLAAGLVGCSSEADDAEDHTDGAGGFPVTVEHVYGTTTIPAKPERIASVAWANHEVPLALGVVPVGMSKATWGDDDGDGVLPWVEERLDELGAETPALFDETDGIDFEAVADTQPDVILAAYSGLTQEDYDTLSKIAPVVAYPDTAWGTSLSEMIELNSAAIGMPEQGEELIAELERESAAALDKHPQLIGKKLLFAFVNPSDLSKIGFYTVHDTRPGFLAELGLPQPAAVESESEKTEDFYVEFSADAVDRFADVDVFVTYGDAEGEIVRQLQSDPLFSQIPAVAEGRIAILEDSTPLAAAANPTPLSIAWGLDDYFALLAGAADPAGE